MTCLPLAIKPGRPLGSGWRAAHAIRTALPGWLMLLRAATSRRDEGAHAAGQVPPPERPG
jgi:hypothetical protein